MVYTDEYDIYARLRELGYTHRTVCHATGEFARDEDGDGFCEVHVNTVEGFWSLLRSWLRPHRGISQEKLPLYLGSFEFVHNVRKRGKAVLGPPKTSAGRRTITLPGFVLECLRVQRRRQEDRRLAAGDAWLGEERIFTTQTGRAPATC